MIPIYLPSLTWWETLKAVLFAFFWVIVLCVSVWILTEKERVETCHIMVEWDGSFKELNATDCLFGRGHVDFTYKGKKYNLKGFKIK